MKQLRILMYILAVLCLFAATSFAQLSKGGTPQSFQQPSKSLIDARVMAPVDVEAMLVEDDIEEQEGLPFRFGAPHDVNYSLQSSGEWEKLPDGSAIWRLRIVSEGAYSINLIYDNFYLPPGAELFVYSEDREMILGAFTGRNNKSSGLFATAPVKGDDITVEYYEPADVQGQGHFTITRIVHAYKDIFGFGGDKYDKAYGSSGSCNNNVNCPEGADWQLESRAVAMVLLGNGTRWCSGSMINNVRQDETPYFLTANHCLSGEENWIIMFRYESPTCVNEDGPTNYTVHGTTLRASNSYSDFALVELSEIPPTNYNIFYVGWSNVDVAASNAVGIHHPSGDIKKISFENDPLTSTTYLGTSGESHWRVENWDDGTTEGGSSGSALFDPSHKLVGQLHGGYASCTSPTADWYGKFSDSWDYGSSASTRLRDWLDPDNTGTTILNGYDPFGETVPVANFSGSPTSGNYPLTVDFTDLSTGTPTSWDWDFGDGVGTSTAQNPSYIYEAVGVYTVTLTATNSFGSDTKIETGYITVTEPGVTEKAYAQSETSVLGTFSGTFANTFASDNSYEVITEGISSSHPRKTTSEAEHRWTFSINGSGSNYMFYVETYRTANSEGDDFAFAYSTDGVNYNSLVTVASTTEQVYSVALPNLSGTVYVRVTDGNRSWGNTSLESIFVDQMYFEYETTPGPPVAEFSGAPTSGPAPLDVSFTDLSTGSPTSWAWTFGDGGTSTAQNPNYTYTANGTYTVSLTATNAYGSDGETKVDYITVADQSFDMHVDDIAVGRRKVGPNYLGTCTVTILEASDLAVSGATVYVTATGPTGGSYSGATGADGTVYFETAGFKKPPGEWCFEVTDVTHATYTYDAGANVVTRACESGPVYKSQKDGNQSLPTEFTLEQNYPNPFNPTTDIQFSLPEAGYIKLEVYNLVGQRVTVLAEGEFSTGNHTATWDASRFASGVYFYRLSTETMILTKKMVLLK
ncbi:MAG: PKD domain-containing protein [candidate division Zixibacteria bacterium]|nr:PKD domain-containing protein [candidate division Zixibacteria bacterium]